MFSVANVLSIIRSLFRLFAQTRPKGISPNETSTTTAPIATGVATTAKPQGNKVTIAGFDMEAEIAKLAARIVEPVAGKLAVEELEPVVGQIRHAFEQLNTKRTTADTSFEQLPVSIMKPAQPMLSDAEFTRVVDRLRGAMVGFCQRSDWGQNAA
jgi:hypothetical protein